MFDVHQFLSRLDRPFSVDALADTLTPDTFFTYATDFIRHITGISAGPLDPVNRYRHFGRENIVVRPVGEGDRKKLLARRR